jgi:hypothetical protein
MKKIIYIILSILIISCIDSDFIEKKDINLPESERVIILNEGNFTYGNSSISIYIPDSLIAYEKVFEKINERPLGDVAQSMTKIGDLFYIVVNNSGKIEVVDNDFNQIKTILGFKSPRYIEPVNDSIAYVSDLYANKISLLNYKIDKVVGEIATGKSTERMVKYKDKIFVTNWSYGQSSMQVINTNTHKLIKTIEIGKDPTDLFLDKKNRLWVLSSGGYLGANYAEAGKIEVFDLDTYETIKTYTFKNLHPSRMCTNAEKNYVYFLISTHSLTNIDEKYGIYKMSIDANSAPNLPYIHQNSGNLFYNFAVYNDSTIYIADAIDYLQKGIVFKYNYENKIDSFSVGVNPQYIYFDKENEN